MPDAFPKSPAPASSFFAVDEASNSAPYQATLSVLEGLVARTQPRLFIEYSNQDVQGNQWARYISSHYSMTYTNITADEALSDFSSYFTVGGNAQIVVYDANDPVAPLQENLAASLAGYYGNAIPVSSVDVADFEAQFPHYTVVHNFTGQFHDALAGYEWLWNLVGPSVTRSFLQLDSGSGVAQSMDYPAEFDAFRMGFSTNSYANSTITAWVDTVLSSYPELTPVFGSFGLGGEGQTIDTLTAAGDYFILDGNMADLSFYSGFPNSAPLSQTAAAPITYDPGKVYVLVEFSQGNSLSYDAGANVPLYNQTDPSTGVPYRAEIPETWQINSFMAELMPPVVDWWYSQASPDVSFMTGASGNGYVHPEGLPDLDQFMAQSASFNEYADIHDYFIIVANASQPLDPGLVSSMVADAGPGSIQALFLKQSVPPADSLIDGLPVFSEPVRSVGTSTYTPTDVSNAVAAIEGAAPASGGFVTFFMAATNPGLPYVKDVAAGLPSNYVLVRADQFADLYLQASGGTTTTSSTTSSSSSTTTTSTTTSTSSTSTSTTTSTTTSTATTSTTSSSTTSTVSTTTGTTTATSTVSSTSTTSTVPTSTFTTLPTSTSSTATPTYTVTTTSMASTQTTPKSSATSASSTTHTATGTATSATSPASTSSTSEVTTYSSSHPSSKTDSSGVSSAQSSAASTETQTQAQSSAGGGTASSPGPWGLYFPIAAVAAAVLIVAYVAVSHRQRRL